MFLAYSYFATDTFNLQRLIFCDSGGNDVISNKYHKSPTMTVSVSSEWGEVIALDFELRVWEGSIQFCFTY